MGKMIGVSQLNNAIAKALREYTSDVEKGLEREAEETAKNAVKKLRTNSPKKHGDYAKGWRLKRTAHGFVIYNATNHQLTHLLEKPHARRGGGSPVQPQKHIEPVEQEAIQEFTKRAEKVIRG